MKSEHNCDPPLSECRRASREYMLRKAIEWKERRNEPPENIQPLREELKKLISMKKEQR